MDKKHPSRSNLLHEGFVIAKIADALLNPIVVVIQIRDAIAVELMGLAAPMAAVIGRNEVLT